MDGLRRKDGELERLVAQVEEGQRRYAENVYRLDVVSDLIAKRRAREIEFERGEEDDYESEQGEYESEQELQDGHESEQEEHEDEQGIIRVKLGHLRIH